MNETELRSLADWAKAWDVLPPTTNRQIAKLRQHHTKLLQHPEIPGAEHMIEILDTLLAVPDSMTDLEIRLWSNVCIVDDEDSCWEFKGYRTPNTDDGVIGYEGKINNSRKTIQSHRLAYMLANGVVESGIPQGIYIRHTCDNPPCSRPKHLIPGTHAENMRDKFERGRGRGKAEQRGEENDSAILTAAIVIEARRRFKAGASAPSLCKDYGVTASGMHQALSGMTWSHLNGIEAPTKGLHRSGSLLNEDDIRTIRAEYEAVADPTLKRDLAAREVMADLAKRYRVGIPNIYAIIKRKSWKHVE